MSDHGETTKQREGVSRIRAKAPEGSLSRARFHGLQEGVPRKIPENVLQEDPKLLMWYGQVLTRAEG